MDRHLSRDGGVSGVVTSTVVETSSTSAQCPPALTCVWSSVCSVEMSGKREGRVLPWQDATDAKPRTRRGEAQVCLQVCNSIYAKRALDLDYSQRFVGEDAQRSRYGHGHGHGFYDVLAWSWVDDVDASIASWSWIYRKCLWLPCS